MTNSRLMLQLLEVVTDKASCLKEDMSLEFDFWSEINTVTIYLWRKDPLRKNKLEILDKKEIVFDRDNSEEKVLNTVRWLEAIE
ncbi:MAG: hypothetical protein K0M69_00555 [Youngiibacter sp.]|nr:hypothetical protein [Youngiibacter sp.]